MNYMYHHLEFKYLNPFYVDSFHAHLSRMLLHVAITLFSPSHPHAHYMLLHLLQTQSLVVSLEKCHTRSIFIDCTVFIISHISIVLWYHYSYLSFVFHRHTHTLTRLSLCLSL